jgi:hypothetical protein
VREKATHLRAEQKIFGNFFCPFDNRFLCWELVKASVDLRGFEMIRIEMDPFGWLQLRRIKYVFPMFVTPARSADVNLAFHFKRNS